MFFEKNRSDDSYELNLELFIASQKNVDFSNHLPRSEGITIPCSIFRQGLSGLEAIIKYLKEEHKLSFSEIGKLLNRDQRTIWSSYNKVKSKNIFLKESIHIVSFNSNILKNRHLSVLECVSLHLKDLGFSIKDISDILGKNSKTIWTVLSRAHNKKLQEVANE